MLEKVVEYNALLSVKYWFAIIAKRWPTVIFPFKQLVIHNLFAVFKFKELFKQVSSLNI